MTAMKMGGSPPGLYRGKTGYMLIYPNYVSSNKASFFNLDGVLQAQCSRGAYLNDPELVPDGEWSVVEWDGPFATKLRLSRQDDGLYKGVGTPSTQYIRYEGEWYVKRCREPRFLVEYVKPLYEE